MNRISGAVFSNITTPSENNSYNLGGVTYDRNGNITYLERTMGSTALADKLTYTYDGNKLIRVKEEGNTTTGFKTTIPATNTAAQYTYSNSGAQLMDNNKGIIGTEYNYLDLPTKVMFNNGNYIQYIYDAVGTKLKKITYEGGNISTTEYVDGFVYQRPGTSTSVLQYIPTEEGYAFKNASGTYSYAYQIKDHLGNVRVTFTDTNKNFAITASEIIEENNYEPFGLKHPGYNTTVLPIGNSIAQKIKYNNREFEEGLSYNINEMDWRHYDPAVGRFVGVDKLAELTTSFSPYVFAYDNPVILTDPSGLSPVYNWDTGLYYDKDKGRNVAFDEVVQIAGIEFFDVDTTVAQFVYDLMGSSYQAGFGGDDTGKLNGRGGGDGFLARAWKWITGKSNIEVGNLIGSDEELTKAMAADDAAIAAANAIVEASSGNNEVSPLGPGMIILGSKLVPKPGGIGGGGASGRWTSIASKTFRATDRGVQRILGTSYKLPFRILGTKGIGAAAGRIIPYAGWIMLSYDLGSVFGPSKWYGDDDNKWFE